jgi:Ala-tRNA(Pro) deacylase
MSYHPVTKQITDLLAEHHVPFRTFEHAPVRTSEEAAALRPDFTMHQGAKALIVKAKASDNGPFFAMLVFPADLKFDSKKAKAAINAKSISFATEEEVAQVTGGIQVGGVPPFGNLFNLPVYVDRSLFGNDEIVFNAGDRSFSVAMPSEDYRKIVAPIVADFVKE